MHIAIRPSGGSGRHYAELLVSKKDFTASHLLREFLPKKASQMASPLSDEDKEVLAYLVAFGQHATGASPCSLSKLPWRSWKSPSPKTSNQQHPLPPDAEVYLKERSLFLTNHDPTFSCDCFVCYASFWSRWNASFNRDVITKVLDEVEICPEVSKGNKKKKKKKKKQDKREVIPQDGYVIKHMEEDAGPPDHCAYATADSSLKVAFTASDVDDALNKRAKSYVNFVNDAPSINILKKEAPRMIPQDEHVIKHIEEDAGPPDHCACTTADSSLSCCDDQSMKGAFTAAGDAVDALNKRAKSYVNFVNDAPTINIFKKAAPRIVTKLTIGLTGQSPGKNMCRVGNRIKETLVASSLTGDIVSRDTREENEASMPSGVVGGIFCRAPTVCDKGNLTTMQACEAMAVGLSLVCMEGKIIPRWTGIRKSKQIMPLDYDDIYPCDGEIEVALVNEDLQAPMAARVADLDLGGKGFLARIFPDALGRAASQLWDLVSVRWRSRTMEYH